MTNRQWLIWKMIDMPDEDFANRMCGQGRVWTCRQCEKHVEGINEAGPYCGRRFHEWLKQEHKDDKA